MSGCGYDFLRYKNLVANATMLTFGKTCALTAGSYCFVDNLGMLLCSGNSYLITVLTLDVCSTVIVISACLVICLSRYHNVGTAGTGNLGGAIAVICLSGMSGYFVLFSATALKPVIFVIERKCIISVLVVKLGSDYVLTYGTLFGFLLGCRTGGRMRYNTVVLGTAVVGADVPVTGLVACPLI